MCSNFFQRFPFFIGELAFYVRLCALGRPLFPNIFFSGSRSDVGSREHLYTGNIHETA